MSRCECGHERKRHLMYDFLNNHTCWDDPKNCSCKDFKEAPEVIEIVIQKDWVRIGNENIPPRFEDLPEPGIQGTVVYPIGDSCDHQWGVWIPVRQRIWLEPHLYHSICKLCNRVRSVQKDG